MRTTLIKSLLLHTPSPHRSCDKIVFTRRMKNIKRYREKSSYTEKTERYWIHILYLYKPSVRAKYIILYRRLVPSSLFLSQTRQYIRFSFHLTFIFLSPLHVPALGFNYMRCEGVKINMVHRCHILRGEITHAFIVSLSFRRSTLVCLFPVPSYIKSTACSFLPRGLTTT